MHFFYSNFTHARSMFLFARHADGFIYTPQCIFKHAFQIDHGQYGAVSLDSFGFIVLGMAPKAMGNGRFQY